LVSFVETLPAKFRLNTKQGKIIHKAYATQKLPGEIVYRKKRGFNTPTERWFREYNGKIASLLLNGSGEYDNLFDKKMVEKILEMHRNGYNMEKQIFLLLNIYFLTA